MAREIMTDDQVAQEIKRLRATKGVKMYEADQRLKNKQRKYMYRLRWMERRGLELLAQGETLASLEGRCSELDAQIGEEEET